MAEYPSALMSQLKPDDNVVAYLPLKQVKGGCLGSKDVPGGYVAITEQRVIANAIEYNDNKKDVKKGNYIEFTTNVPVSKVSSMTVTHKQVKGGCLSGTKQTYWITLNIQGAQHELYVGQSPSTANEFVRTFVDRTE